MPIRPYQEKAIQDLREGTRLHLRQVLCAPTGAGKTRMFSDIAASAAKKIKRVIIATDRIELFNQTLKSIERVTTGIEVMKPKSRISDKATVIIAMVETLNNRLKGGWNWKPDLIIIDEAHKKNFNKIIDHWPNTKVIGATATPVGIHFHKYYTNIVETEDVKGLIKLGFLTPCRAFQMQDDLSDLKIKAGKFTEDSLFEHYNKAKLYAGVVEKWKEKANGLKTLVFCVNIKHAEETNQEFLKAGIVSEVITSKTKKEDRERILKAHQNGHFPVLVNCGILTTGYDDASIRCIIIDRATLSLPLFLQMCGRGSRIFEGKNEFIILDFGMNHDRFGRWDAERIWSLDAPKKKKKGEQAAAVKLCPKCEAMLFVSARKCEYCGYIYPETDKVKEKGVLVEVPEALVNRKLSTLSLPELLDLQKAKKYQADFIWRIVRSRGEDEVKNYAMLAKYSQGWVYRQINDLENCSFTDFILK